MATPKKIIICGYSHCGTSILKSIIGHIEEVEEIFIMSDKMKLDSIDFRVMTPHELYNKLLPNKKQIDMWKNIFLNKEI